MAAGDLQRGAPEDRLEQTTIFALATGAVPSAIAIVRISGSQALAVLHRLTKRAPPPARRLTRRRLIDTAGDPLDDALVALFPGPASVTGDDMVELHLHGGPAVVRAVLATLDRYGLSAAGPGAFTRRAFDNGKLDVGQVEGLRDLIAAETDSQRCAALARTGSQLAVYIDRWRDMLLAARRDVEAMLDFAEDDVGEIDAAATIGPLRSLLAEMVALRDDVDRGTQLRDGLTIAITGPANAGKSTLLNALARRDAALVSPFPGTTRDVVEVRLLLGGVLVNLLDTAGDRATVDPLEAQAIERGVERVDQADVVISLGPTSRSDAIVVAAKSDLASVGAGWRHEVLHLSAATGAGMALLHDELARRVQLLLVSGELPVVASRRQATELDKAIAAVRGALATTDVVLTADGVSRALLALDRLNGRPTDDLLDAIFSRFCIGK